MMATRWPVAFEAAADAFDHLGVSFEIAVGKI